MSGPVGLAFALRYSYNSEALSNGVDGNFATNPAPAASGPGADTGL